jgi:hypothetical protein
MENNKDYKKFKKRYLVLSSTIVSGAISTFLYVYLLSTGVKFAGMVYMIFIPLIAVFIVPIIYIFLDWKNQNRSEN